MLNDICGDDLDDLLREPRVGKLAGIAGGGRNLLRRQYDIVFPDQSSKLIALVVRDDYIDATVQAAVRCQVLLQLGEGNRIEYVRLNNDVQAAFPAVTLETQPAGIRAESYARPFDNETLSPNYGVCATERAPTPCPGKIREPPRPGCFQID